LNTLFGSLLLEFLSLFWGKPACLFCRLDLIKYGFEFDRRTEGRYGFRKDVVFRLDVVYPSADAEKSLVSGEKVFGFGGVDETDRL